MVTNQVSPLGAQDFSSYLTNIANSGAESSINVNWGRDAVLSIQQAKQFGLLPKMKLVIPYQIPFLAQEVGAGAHGGRLRGHRFLVDAARTSIRSPRCSSRRSRRSTATGPSGAPRTPTCQFAHLGAHGVERPARFYPPDVIKPYEKGEKIHVARRRRALPRRRTTSCVRPVVIVKGKKPKAT